MGHYSRRSQARGLQPLCWSSSIPLYRDPRFNPKEAPMWEAIKNALMSAKEATGIEIPGLPADLGSIGDSAATAVQTVTESANGAIDGAAGAAETAAAAVDSASQALPDLTSGLTDGSPKR